MTKAEKTLIPAERIEELKAMATGLYGTIGGLTEHNPHDAITVLTMIHLMIWFNAGNRDGYTAEEMLKDYCENFLNNVAVNEQARKSGGIH
jgi:hypothetical protein